MNAIFLDWASTSPVSDQVLEEYLQTSRTHYGNASSQHLFGRLSLERLEADRTALAGHFGVSSNKLYFTSGGSESNRIVVESIIGARRRSKGRIIVSAIEHPSVSDLTRTLTLSGFEVVTLDAPGGFVSERRLLTALTPETAGVFLISVNNVTGSIQPIHNLIPLIRAYEGTQGMAPIHVHVDMVQALGKITLPAGLFDVDSASFSAHKVMGPKGLGILYARRGLVPVTTSGTHEQSIRSGTVPCPLIAASRVAIEDAILHLEDHLRIAEGLRDHLLSRIADQHHLYPLIDACGMSDRVHPSFITLVCGRIPSEVLVRVLSDRGFAVSAGSACSSRDRKKRQRVITAMGFPSDIASSVIRISTGPTTTIGEIDRFCDTLITECITLDPVRKGRRLPT